MRNFRNVFLLLIACATTAMAETVVTIRGSIQSLDSSRANVIVRSTGQDRLIILPANVPVRIQGNDARTMSVGDLAEGSTIVVDAVKTPNGQLTARSITIQSMDGEVTSTGPSPANKVSVQASRGATSGVRVTSDSSSATQPFVAARANLLNQPVGELHINGRTVFRFRGIRGEDPYVRAQTVAARLNSPAMRDIGPSEVMARRVGGQWTVMARGTVLITADSTTARINRTTPRQLAALWAANMRAQLREG